METLTRKSKPDGNSCVIQWTERDGSLQFNPRTMTAPALPGYQVSGVGLGD